MEIFLLLDRTGSMHSRWDEAVSSVNAYVEEVRTAMGVDLLTDADRVTLAAFDQFGPGMDFRVLRDGQPLKAWVPMTLTEVAPRGNTPLLDAVVRISALAEAKGADKTVVVIMTDGAENASTEVTKDGAKAAIGRLQARGWQVVFLGVDFDAFTEAAALGVRAAQTMSTSGGHYKRAAASTAHSTAAYYRTGATMAYTDKDRKEAGEDDVTKKK